MRLTGHTTRGWCSMQNLCLFAQSTREHFSGASSACLSREAIEGSDMKPPILAPWGDEGLPEEAHDLAKATRPQKCRSLTEWLLEGSGSTRPSMNPEQATASFSSCLFFLSISGCPFLVCVCVCQRQVSQSIAASRLQLPLYTCSWSDYLVSRLWRRHIRSGRSACGMFVW